MARIEPVGSPQRNADGVERNRVVVSNPLESADRRSAAHVVFGVDLEPADHGPVLEHLGHVGRAEADAAVAGTHRGSLDTGSPLIDARAAARPCGALASC